ncbi:MAG: NHLP family bacteriocin export ABC transporter permease/ATPase subunit, partial [Clostridia bacterium]|nr:NHLP family bacteriocin export ABC transporter permease/ATPase subunit [Clostridia bacterium]
MGWFDDQIEFRKKREKELLRDSIELLARSVTGRKIRSSLADQEDVSDAVAGLLKYFGIKERETPANIRGLQDRLDFLLSSTGILYREVILKKGWHADAMGPMITSLREEGTVITVLPSHMGGYEYEDPRTGKSVHINAQEEKKISEE